MKCNNKVYKDQNIGCLVLPVGLCVANTENIYTPFTIHNLINCLLVIKFHCFSD